jgi:hypothetical protein
VKHKNKVIVGIVLLSVEIIAVVAIVLSGFVLSYTIGHSMEPTWKYLNIVYGHKIHSPTEIQIGAIVGFRDQGIIRVHRVVDILQDPKGYLFFSWGDNRVYCKNMESFRFEQVAFVIDGQIGIL